MLLINVTGFLYKCVLYHHSIDRAREIFKERVNTVAYIKAEKVLFVLIGSLLLNALICIANRA